MDTCTPPQPHRPVLSPWRNEQFPFSLVQAAPRAGAPLEERRLQRDACSWHDPDRPCPGTGDGAVTTGVLLEHRQAVHAIHAHYKYPNQSVLRFKTAARCEYAVDAVWEIDAHGREPELARPLDYAPFVRVALLIGRRIFDFLVGHLDVDPRWITTCVTRMGVTVCVDWRAFGPRRTWEVLLLVRWVESQVFTDGELPFIGTSVDAELKIDCGIYGFSERARRPGVLGGHFLRPVGALHSKSSDSTCEFRKTPIPHDEFRPENAELLTLASRGISADTETWARCEWLRTRAILRWPETRWPGADSHIEGNLPLASGLVELLEREGLAGELPPEYRREVASGRERSLGGRKFKAASEGTPTIDDDVIARIAKTIDPAARERSDGFQMDCPRPGCKQHGKKAIIFKGSGVFCCFRSSCLGGGGMSLGKLCEELNLSHLLPKSHANSKPIQRRLIEDVKQPLEQWPGTFIERHFDDLEDARADQKRVVERFLDDERARLLTLLAAPGIGKTTTVATVARERGLRLRAFLSRDDAKAEFAKLVPEARVLIGRRLRTNCWNEDLTEVSSRHESIAQVLCGGCEQREKCEAEGYLSQFKELPHSAPLVVHHNIAIHADLAMFDNESALDFIDEDALSAAVEHIDFTTGEVALLRTRLVLDPACVDEDGSLGPDGKLMRVASTSTWETILSGLERWLSADAILVRGLADESPLADLVLADLLFTDPTMRAAVERLDSAAFEAIQADVLALRETDANLRAITKRAEDSLKRALPKDASVEEATAAAEGRKMNECLLDVRKDREGLQRPLDRAKELVDALGALLFAHETRRNVTSALQLLRTARASSWVLRLTTRRPLLQGSKKVIHASASMTAERMQLTHGSPTPDAGWTVYRPTLPQRERWTVVADKTYGKGMLLTRRDAERVRGSLFEVVRKLIEIEGKRTKLPVAVIGLAEVVNAFNKCMLGDIDADLEMPFSTRREERMKKLREVTEPRGYICGYAYGVAGSNSFKVDVDGKTAFLRALVILGNCVPNLREYAEGHRGLFAGAEAFVPIEGSQCDAASMEDLHVDWTMAFRTVPVPGTEANGEVTVLTNVPGYVDPRANAVLAGTFEGELRQIAGRIRGYIPDPRDPTIQPRVYQFGAAVVPGVRVDRVVALDDLRAELGLQVQERRKRGRRPSLSFSDQIRRRVKEDGKTAAIRWVAQRAVAEGNADPLLGVRLAFQNAGIPYAGAEITAARRALAAIRGTTRPGNSL